ncbi:MAG TPA: phosphoribosylformylglycinamidine cyclo-ligase [Methanothermobacter sp.]|jgi:phosphoribosylformylglycinamidine cyclo-ligase|uniref:Phosphoribosylformylglycinamidine cyclo-ligase n=1 Tax=Methanothermobacter tenebrarum TaxID=680118 RepID=A0ABM7YC61_9EURY|nr:phosphoribosylformylglycinamidine cyclo-ligase [Methanothermobacter tenebrarum]MDD3454844.1 phosphoribosylformylglycinamidine cyclo-ligase [Methanobacteriales archaeon]MDI6882319.1 phosphoribosylformylglycinamidine cyclo-ligase [Methanothermobacter sp.]MDX9693582.1 phosphoribosylformylglycinamidine cyclo-ligase [Methanothermobacter sp.]BDH78844.1 phosphoribosylaminoimidazole synthetase [Methanothermobacter tenebrarum]HHW17052.1 phosphoribosylformylglycinamidine cyclo-ligase [Methanothermoba
MVTYADSGVDIDLEALTVSKLVSKLEKTLKYANVLTRKGHFASIIRVGDMAIAMSTDGVGSKILVAEKLGKYDTIGIDCIAMVVNDILCVGAKPIAIVDYLAMEKPDPEIASEIGEGLAKGAELAETAIIGGETATLPEIVDNFDLAATGIGITDPNNIITGEKIKAGDRLIGIESSGIHSNGLTLARKIFFEKLKLNINDPLPGSKDKIGEELLKPTRIYVKPILELLKSEIKVHGLAHITGGGYTNIRRLNDKVTYKLDNLPEPQPVFKAIHENGVPIDEMYRVFNMGIGFIIVVDKEDANKTIKITKKTYNAREIGTVEEDPTGAVKIKTYTQEDITL